MRASAPLPHLILAQAVATPDAVAIRCAGVAMTYRTLHRQASGLAAQLRELGVREETLVAVLAVRSPETIVAILAIHYAGGAYVPLDPEYPAGVLAFTLADCGARIVLGTRSALERLPAHQLTTVGLDGIAERDSTLAEVAPCPDASLAYVIYTSGSTGMPKGVLVSHGNLAHSTHARGVCYREKPTRFLLLSSFAFDSSVAGLFWTLSTGGTLVLSSGEERDPAALAACIAAERITHTLCLPLLHQLLLGTPGDLDSLETVIVAGEACPSTLPAAHHRRLPHAGLFNEYGPTEATVWTTFAKLDPAHSEVSIGRPIPGAEVRLLDESGEPVRDGEPGEIHIGGAGVARGYWRQPDLTAKRFLTTPDGARLYKTGDLARRRPEGDLEFLGRLDRQVKLRGYRIELEAIEAAIQSHADVHAAAVVVREDEAGDPRLVAYVAPADCAIPTLRALLAEKFPAFMQPSAFLALDALPRMPNGKVDRAALPAPTRERPTLESDYVPPRDSVESFLAEEWRGALRLDRVGIHDRFFELGGDSLRAAALCARLQEKLGEPVFVVAIFEAPTIAQLAAYFRQHYATAVARVFAEQTAAGPASERRIDAARLAGVRSLIVRGPRPSAPVTRKNRRAIFILAPPRSGTTLLRAMLARHPALFTASELRLLGFRTLGERRAAYAGSGGVWRQGILQAIAEAKGCDANEAAHLLDTYERLDLGTGEFFALLQQWLGERVLVDKSPSYALDPECLRHAESLFSDAFYIHLARHPYEMIRSFESRHMDRIYLPGAEELSAREAGEAVWLIAHRNIRDFLATIPSNRRLDLRFSDLVSHPRETLEALCEAAGIDFDPALLDPYEGVTPAENRVHTPDDPRFHEHGAIKPEVAEGWRGVLQDNFLSELTWDLAEELGYEKPEELRSVPRVPSVHAVPDNAIAIIGMSGRFPGARDVGAFWKNLCEGVESIRPFTAEELRASGIDPAVVSEPRYVNAGAQIDDADQFAAAFFGYTPREAELMDPQQRIFLECAWEAFEHAGCDISRFPGAVGVFAGLALNDYFQFNLATRPELTPLLGTYALTLGNEKDFVATRVAHKLRLRGPAIGVQTACSTSLVALHLACQSLRSGECDMALVGGGRISVPLHAGYEYVDGGIPSPDGHCRAFDAQARGCVPASGMATVVIKRLADAVRDGDHIYSVIRGTAINNDAGNKAGFTAPSVEGQAEVIARAHSAAGVSADSIGYVEAHGTGTSLGDPIEIAGLTRAFRQTTDATGFCRIGSVKTNIGHLDTGAGAAGLIKAALALDRSLIPPSLHYTAPNPQIDFARSPFVVNAALTKWPRTSTPRRAGVSSFGIGGTNAHAVIEEAPLVKGTAPSRPWQLLILSARTATALDAATANLARHLREHPDAVLADVAHTLQSGRREFEHRRIVVARSVAEAAEALEKRDPARVFTAVVAGATPDVIFMFPGQGSQYPGMARELFEGEPVFRQAMEQCAQILAPRFDLLATLYPTESETAVTDTAIAQPAIFAIEYALASLWQSWGIRPAALLGHSVGEFAAACLAGVLTLEDALDLVAERARLMQEMPAGAMLAVRLSESELQPHLGDSVELAAINSPRLCVVSGPTEAIARFTEKMIARDVATVPLRTSHAFHSAMMEPAAAGFSALAASVEFRAPGLPIVSTLTATSDADFTQPDYWRRQLREPVRFAAAVATIAKERVLLEVGPGATLAALARQSRGGAVIASQDSGGKREHATVLEALGRLWLAGITIDWRLLHASDRRLRVPLPTYPFERERYWLEPGQRPTDVQPEGVSSAAQTAPAVANEETESPATALDQLRAFLHGMSGVPVEKMAPAATLLELGFDSLFLTQVALGLRKTFGVEISFRQLFEEFATIEALAGHLASGAPSQPQRSSTTAAPAPAAKLPVQAHGPFRPIQKDSAEELTDAQRQHLLALTARYVSRTAASKRRTQQERSHFADPRSVSGFRPYWKELTYPIIVERSAGARMWDADGHEYLDFTMGFGTNLLGHSPVFITEAISAQLARGIEIGPQSPVAGEVARLLCEASGLDRAAFCNTGSEAVLAAVRVARTVTGRTLIATFSGYHGITDEFLIRGKTINGERRSMPIAPGIPDHLATGVLALDYGTEESLALLRRHAHEIAAVLVEPVQSRHPDLQPREFLHEVRRITREAGAALVFDEVITGFRCHPGGAQAWFDVQADLVTYGKIIGGGLPMGALCGRREYLDALDGGAWSFGDDSRPEVGVTFFAGTFVRHPLAMAASHAMLKFLKADAGLLQATLNERTAHLVAELNCFLAEKGVPIRCETFASMFLVKFAENFSFGAVLFFLLREKGIHAWDNRLFFLSTAHTDADLAHFVRAFRVCIEEMAPWFDGIEAGWSPTIAAPIAADAQTFPLTPAQRGLFALAARNPEASRAYNESSALDLRGPLDLARLETALREVIERHDALRTSIAPDGETQTVHPRAPLAIPLTECSDDAELRAAIAAVRSLHFNLACAPIMDARLLRRGPAHHVLLVTLHHTFCNGPSLDVLFDEIFSLYEGRALPPAMQLREFVQRRLKPGRISAEAFWKMQFAHAAPPLELPLDRPRPAVKTYAGGRATMTLEPTLVTALRQAGAKHGASLFMTLLSAYQILLHRLSGQDDVVVGVPFEGSDRTEPGGERLIANSTNVAPLRSRIESSTTFADLLAANRRLVLEATEHQDYFFGDLVAALALPFDASRAPLFNALFNFETGRFQRDLDGLHVELLNDRGPWLGLRGTAIFELFLNVAEHDGALHCRVDFNRDLFDAATIQRWLGHLRTLLDAIATDASQPIARLPLLDARERSQLVTEWNATALEFPREASLHSLVEEMVRRQPDACAILDHGRRITYRELDLQASSIAAHLRAQSGAPPAVVGVCMRRSAGMIAAIIGVLKAGAAYLPLDPSYPPERLAFMIEDSRVAIVLCDGETAADHAGQHPSSTWVDIAAAVAQPGGSHPAGTSTSTRSSDLAYLIYTSGSTGRPKGVALEHRNAVAFIHWALRIFSREELAGVLASTSICFDLSIFEIFAPLATGGTVVLAQNVLELPTLPDAAAVTLVNTVPSAMAELIRAWNLPPGVRTVNLAGERLPESLVAAVYRSGTVRRVLDLYGPTETTTYSTFTERRPGAAPTIGRPIANTAVYILDEHLQPVPIGVAGEIYIGGAGVARGYWAQPALTAERFLPDPFQGGDARMYKTGDRAHWRADGQIVYLGRNDHQVKVRGHRIELGEIETVLAQDPSVREAAVIATTEADGEVRIIAYIVPASGHSAGPSRRELLQQRLPEFMIPAAFVTLAALPRTANGKIDRRALPAPGAATRADTADLVEPRDEEERRVAEVWRQVLKIGRVGVHENFFDLGGHSLAAMQVASRLRETVRAGVNFLDVFERPTIASLAETLRGKRAGTEIEEGVL